MLSPRAIFKHSSKISIANFIGLAVAIPTGIIATRVLGPERYGLANVVLLWPYYADLFRPGLMAAAGREIPTLLAAGRRAEAERAQNAAVTGEGAYGVLALLIVAAASLLYKDPVAAAGLRLAAIAFAFTHAYSLLISLQWAHQRFGPLSRVTLYSRLSSSLVVLSTVWWLGPYSLVLAPGFAALIGLVLIATLSPLPGLRLAWDGAQMKRLFVVGVMMMLFSYSIQGFKVLDRTAIAAWMSHADLGYFGFALNLVFLGVIAIGDFQSVMQPMVWSALGREGASVNVAQPIRRVAVVVLAVTCAGAALAQATFGAFVHVLVPNFVASIPVFDWLVLLLPVYTASNFPSVLLMSSTLNRQGINAAVWGGGVALKALALVLVLRVLHFGLTGVALAGVAAQVLVVVGLYASVRRFLFESRRQAAIFSGWLAALFLVSVALAAVFQSPVFAYSATRILPALAWRGCASVMVWSLLGALVYRRWGRGTGPEWPFAASVTVPGAASS